MHLYFFFKQKTGYKMRISYWSSDVCSSDLHEYFRIVRRVLAREHVVVDARIAMAEIRQLMFHLGLGIEHGFDFAQHRVGAAEAAARWRADVDHELRGVGVRKQRQAPLRHQRDTQRSAENTSAQQSIM